ncbi:hypothetical protein KAK05_03715 [Candidatus Parcubacteria bacterium]|nr:hypothetical protein [Candidatus Parcubacteria bacterium]
MTNKLVTVVLALSHIIIGISYMLIATIAFVGIDISMITDSNIFLIEAMKESVIFNIIIFIASYFVLSFGVNMLGGKIERVVALNMNINYEIIEIETNDSQSTVRLLLKDSETGDMVSVERKTKNLAYFKGYFESFGNRMLGSFAKTI